MVHIEDELCELDKQLTEIVKTGTPVCIYFVAIQSVL